VALTPISVRLRPGRCGRALRQLDLARDPEKLEAAAETLRRLDATNLLWQLSRNGRSNCVEARQSNRELTPINPNAYPAAAYAMRARS
jgi:hypothetical protein